MKKYWNWLYNVEGMWHGKVKKMLEFYETPKNIYMLTEKQLRDDKVADEKTINNIIEKKEVFDIDEEFEKIEKKGIKLVTVNDEEYPEKLKNIYDFPYILYVAGKLPKNEKIISIVGARGCSEYGIYMAGRIGEFLAQNNISTISGMARGIDTFGHNGTLRGGGITYAVLGCGVDICYPTENIELYEEIKKRGGLISEYPPGTKPDGWRFPQRNRIISGMSDGIIVVEARKKSGSLITAEHAIEQGKDVMAVPGRMTDALSEGCNELIKEGAQILINETDILDFFGIISTKCNEKINNSLEKDFDVVYSLTDLTPISMEELVKKTGFKVEKVFEILLNLQMRGLIYEPVKNYYAKKI